MPFEIFTIIVVISKQTNNSGCVCENYSESTGGRLVLIGVFAGVCWTFAFLFRGVALIFPDEGAGLMMFFLVVEEAEGVHFIGFF